ncbi:MAG: hypothetical protein NTW19_12570 [Planctomycetota bacterium]|nr:hypothetical protein [Planctomycetota bacterium]
MGGLLGPRGQEVLIPAGASPLTGEPASLPSPTSLDPTAVRESGFTRGQGAEAEEFITWRLPGTGMRAAQDFYERAAREAGLTAVPTLAATQPTAATRLMFAAPGKAPGAVLMVRIRPLSHEGTSVMLWLRPASTGSKP